MMCFPFLQIAENKKRCGSLAPRKFIAKVKKENVLFSSYAHQDAHEFFSYLLNDISEKIVATRDVSGKHHGDVCVEKGMPSSSGYSSRSASVQELHELEERHTKEESQAPKTFVDELFRGTLVTETKCLWCENVSRREEPFYDLSLEIEQNCSLSSCLKQFSSTETLQDDEKFFCDACGRKQEAQKRMRLASLPQILCFHLKRFKYVERIGQMKKLTHRVVFPFDLKLTNTTEDCPDKNARFRLKAIVVHMGAHINHGHYVALIKSGTKWLCFDDDQVVAVTENQVRSTFGHARDPILRPDGNMSSSMDHAYILLYERAS